MPFATQSLRSTLLLCIAALLGGCGSRSEHRAPDLQLLATDVYVSVAQQTLVLPFVALKDHAFGGVSFSLNRKADSERAAKRRAEFLRDTRDPRHPLVLDLVSVDIYSYGASEFDNGRGQLCTRLSRQWARSMCDGSGGIRFALPSNGFKLVNLAQLRLDAPNGPANCLRDRKQNALPSVPGHGATVCPAQVFGGDEDQYQTAIVRINGDLGAMWTVWGKGQSGESAQAMAERQGNAITLFVETALGDREDYPKLERGTLALKQPGL